MAHKALLLGLINQGECLALSHTQGCPVQDQPLAYSNSLYFSTGVPRSALTSHQKLELLLVAPEMESFLVSVWA